MTAHQIKPGPLYKAVKPVRDEDYKRFIRQLPCLICLKQWGTEAAHTGDHGIGQKASDLSCIPLCVKHHRRAPDSYHKLGRVRFEARHKLNIAGYVAEFNHFYQTKIRKQAA